MNLPVVSRRRRVISLTPLVDVVLILLVFYMLASSYLGLKELPLTTPAPQGQQTTGQGALLVRLYDDGQVDLGGLALPREELLNIVRKRLVRQPDQGVLLQPQGETNVQTLVGLLDELRALGAYNVVLGEP